MTATDELRRMLDERGVEWWQSANTLGCVFTRWYSPLFGDEVCAMENGEEGLVLFDHFVTPEQAVEATLGRGTCSIRGGECDQCGAHIHRDAVLFWVPAGEGLRTVESRDVSYCPNCGARVIGEDA